MKLKVVLTPSRDVLILQFLWKWKIAPTKALAEKYFRSANIDTAYRRLIQLQKAGYIESKYSHNAGHVWQLTHRGFKAIRQSLPTLKEEGFKSEKISHDILVAAIHIGDFLKSKPQNVNLFSEQELRRYDSSEFPEWLQNLSNARRPDGYWAIATETKYNVIALEVEITQKAESKYISILESYNDSNIDCVLWVARNDSTAYFIRSLVVRYFPRKMDAHCFALVDDFFEKQWESEIVYGRFQGKSIADFLRRHGAPVPLQRASNRPPNLETHPFLQIGKSFAKSTPSQVFKIGESFD